MTNETSGVSILDAGQVHYLDHVETEESVQVRLWTGEHLPAHAVASGLAMLAFSPADVVEEHLLEPLEPYTANTMTDRKIVDARLAEARSNGFVWVTEELSEGLNSVGAPVLDENGLPIAALHVHGPAYRFPEDDADRYGRLVADAAAKLSDQIR